MRALCVAAALMLMPSSASTLAGQQAAASVWLGDELAVTYRARIEGDWLVVDARHEPGWHTYAMDNLSRARERSGSDDPETELGTSIASSPGLELQGPWRQSPPVDLSQPDIRWFTWGFEGQSFFAVRLAGARLPAFVSIDAQVCTESLCAWADALEVPVSRAPDGAERTIDPDRLEPVGN